MGKMLVWAGLLLVIAGLVVWLLGRGHGGGLPGDIVIERKSVRFYFPVVTCLLASLVLSLLLWLWRR